MTGKELKNIIDNSRIKVADIIAKSGIPKTTFYNLLGQDVIEDFRIEDLEKSGLKFPKSAKTELETNEVSKLQDEIERLNKMVTEITSDFLGVQKKYTALLEKQMIENEKPEKQEKPAHKKVKTTTKALKMR